MPDPTEVRSMFGRIAGRYDLLNRLLSLGIDKRWRSAAVRQAGELEGRVVADACCGTGDLTLAFAESGARALGVDFVPEMIARAADKGAKKRAAALFTHGDALRLPLRDGSVDVASVAFGIRNVADRERGFAELARVVRAGGRVLVLEFSMPPGALLGALYRFYFTRLLPCFGRVVSGDRAAYAYLPRTVLAWPSPPELQREMERAGLVDCGHRLLTRGIACLHWGTVRAEGRSAARTDIRPEGRGA
jgi:demethylmenaquinone methyltransferase/2-methoxy-6-polyprenyl-1,4-benzoquinol methylase